MPLYNPAMTTTLATDTLWDDPGDLAVASGANTAAKLAIGSVGGVLGRVNGAVAWNGGTSFPGSKATDDRFYRSDLDIEFVWDGTRWLGLPTILLPIPTTAVLAMPYSTTTGGSHRMVAPPLLGGSDAYLTTLYSTFHVASGGTALGASHKWVCTVNKTHATTSTAIATVTIDSGNSAEWRQSNVGISALMNNGTTEFEIDVTCTKTGTPGNLYIAFMLGYRVVAT